MANYEEEQTRREFLTNSGRLSLFALLNPHALLRGMEYYAAQAPQLTAAQRAGLENLDDAIARYNTQQLLNEAEMAANPELEPAPIGYGIVTERIPARRETRYNARPIGYYSSGSMLRFKPLNGEWSQVVQDSHVLIPQAALAHGNIYVPNAYLDEVTSDDLAPLEYEGEKEIRINRGRHFMQALVNGEVVNEVPISTGKRGHETPTGTFRINRKRPARLMQGYDNGVYWGVFPGWVQYFTDQGHAIHGAYWNNKLGRENLSHGCANTSNEDAKWFYRFAGPVYDDLTQEEIFGDRNSTKVTVV